MTLFIELLGSIALLLWGLRMVRTGIMRAYGTSLKRLAQHTENRILPAFGSGLIVATLLQSSTATALIAAAFSGQGVVSTASAFIFILGADVGTAIAVLIVSQKLTGLTYFLLAAGVFGFLLSDTNKQLNSFRALSGLGLILLALSMISATALELSAAEEFLLIIQVLETQPAILMLFALLMTYLAHSSLAVVLLASGFFASGLVGLEGGLVLVLGANLGSGLLPVISSWNNNVEARIPVTANLLIRAIGVAIAFLLLGPLIAQSPVWINNWLIPAATEQGIDLSPLLSVYLAPAAFHLALNLCVAFLGILFSSPLIRVTNYLLPQNPDEEDESKPKHLDFNNFSSPAHSLACAKRETLNMADITQNMLRLSLNVLRDQDENLRQRIMLMDDNIDRLYIEIKLYIARVLQEELTREESQLALDLLSFTTNMEHIGDIIDGGLMALAGKKITDQIQFSDEGLAEISKMHQLVCSNFELAVNTYISGDSELAHQLYETKAELRKLEKHSVVTHLNRLGMGVPDSLATSALHIDVLRDLKRINSHISSTAYLVLNASGEVLDRSWKSRAQLLDKKRQQQEA
ncbi:MAG: Na/Pi cotransporter family protein [Thiolinea sp.]